MKTVLVTIEKIHSHGKARIFKRPVLSPTYERILGYNSVNLITSEGEHPLTDVSPAILNMIVGMLERNDV